MGTHCKIYGALSSLRGIEQPTGPDPVGRGRKQRNGSADFNEDREWGKKPGLMVTSTRHIISIIIIEFPAFSCQGYLVVDMGLFSH